MNKNVKPTWSWLIEAKPGSDLDCSDGARFPGRDLGIPLTHLILSAARVTIARSAMQTMPQILCRRR